MDRMRHGIRTPTAWKASLVGTNDVKSGMMSSVSRTWSPAWPRAPTAASGGYVVGNVEATPQRSILWIVMLPSANMSYSFD